MRLFQYLFTLFVLGFLAACGGGGGSAGTPSGTINPITTSAPSALTLAVGSSQGFSILGGKAPFQSSSNDVNVATTSVSGTSFSVNGLAAGEATITISDSSQKTASIKVTVPAPPVPPGLSSNAPLSLQILNGSTNFYKLFGGVPPYVVNTNGVIAKAVISGSDLAITGVVPGDQTVAISDAAGDLIAIDVKVNSGLFTDAPRVLSLANGTAATYTIFGGTPYSGSARYRVNSSVPSVATASVSGSTLSIIAITTGQTILLITDSVGDTIQLGVTVPAASAILSTAPADGITLVAGTPGVTYDLSGGDGTYTATSSNPALVTASVSGSRLTIRAEPSAVGGTANVIVTDAKGSPPLTIQVTSSVVKFFTTAPSALRIAVGVSNTFALVGGSTPYSVANTHPSIVTGSVSDTKLMINGLAAGSGTVIVSDGKNQSISIAVTVDPNPTSVDFYVAAPTSLNLSAATSSTQFQVSGGTKPYSVISTDSRVATGVIDSSDRLTVNALSVGTATLTVADALGLNPFTMSVTVDNTGGTGPSVAASIDILASSNTLESAPGSLVSFIVTVKDAKNGTLPDQPVTFTANSGTLTGINPTPQTNAAGTISTVSLAPGADASNRSITVTATAGSVVKTIVIPVTGTKVSINGAGSALLGSTQNYTVIAVDSAGKAISGASLRVTSKNGNTVSPQTVVTESSGSAQVTVTATVADDTTATKLPDTLTVTYQGSSADQIITANTTQLSVSSEDFVFTTTAAEAALWSVGTPSTPNRVTVRYRKSGVPQPGKTVTLSTTRGTISPTSVVTDANGEAFADVLSNNSGPATISATLTLPVGTARSTLTGAFIARVPATIVLQANPSAVPPNVLGSTTNKSELTAVVRDALGNPVKDVVVNFASVFDGSNGNIDPGSVTTDASGLAKANFIPGALTTAANSVEITATAMNPETNAAAATSTAKLTVSGEALFISIGRGSVLAAPDTTKYVKDFTVYVTDANGAPVVNRAVKLSIWPTYYGKGSLFFNSFLDPEQWTYAVGSPFYCDNEDANRSGILDSGEDKNGDGILQPGIPVAITSSVTTDASGFGSFTVTYGKNFAWWLKTEITATALVGGTESKQLHSYDLEMLFADAVSPASPANVVSPFGTVGSCASRD